MPGFVQTRNGLQRWSFSQKEFLSLKQATRARIQTRMFKETLRQQWTEHGVLDTVE